MKKCVITSAVRTAVGGYLGSLKTVPPEELGKIVLEEVLIRSGITPDKVEQAVMGDVLSNVPNLARVSALLAGYGVGISAFSVNRLCGSGLQAVLSASHAIYAGEAEVVVAGGAENMSRAPYYMPDTSRYEGFRMGSFKGVDSFEHASFNCHPASIYPKLNMGITAENVAKKYGITRETADAFACHSQRKAKEAMEAGKFKDEIIPVDVRVKKASFVFDTDEHPKPETTIETLAKLKPVFLFDGTGVVTAGNSSGMNDGASAVVLMTEEKANELGCKPMVEIVGSATAGVDPSLMGLGPVPAIKLALKRAGLAPGEIDLFEINEAFATQSLACLIELDMPFGSELYQKVNVNGGAVAHGHALGNSGTRLLTTLIYEMKKRNSKYGCVSLCIGGGQGIALIVKNC
jgi:acetyl-CoA C-acetyltransferase